MEKLLATQTSTTNKKSVKKFDAKDVKKITFISFPMEVEDPKRHKAYKILVKYSDLENKTHDRTIYFGEKIRVGAEYINHKNDEVRRLYVDSLQSANEFFDKNFMNKWILNGEKTSIIENWEALKNKYINLTMN